MKSKVEREREALEQAEQELRERRAKLAELEKQESAKAIDKLVKSVGRERAIEILELSLQVKPKVALDKLRELAGGSAKA
ncbi:hypothetical protein PK98_15160 [Croceibacterium mercuriale]|uniref:Uncharacterized protein n=1 Tax=Croceibacterium mercuriale TaxID=1572751 RepID=A0A0B2BWF5_9SPHN|nr:hypothetical protein [Croceibacterium mercuriale]KHL24297.1 hypothetical protein PK98_15160 [Croceibacterium mercuriale]